MSDIEKEALKQENIVFPLILGYQRRNIHCQPCWRFSMDGSPKMSLTEYPKTCEYPCNKCWKHFDGMPIYVPHQYDSMRKVYLLLPFPFHSFKCAKLYRMEANHSKVGQYIEWLERFRRDLYIANNIPFDGPIGSIPLSCIKGRSPYGTITEEEYAKEEVNSHINLLMPTMAFVDTSIEEIDNSIKEARRRKVYESIPLTEVHQKQYEENIRIAQEKAKVEEKEKRSQPVKKMMASNAIPIKSSNRQTKAKHSFQVQK